MIFSSKKIVFSYYTKKDSPVKIHKLMFTIFTGTVLYLYLGGRYYHMFLLLLLTGSTNRCQEIFYCCGSIGYALNLTFNTCFESRWSTVIDCSS